VPIILGSASEVNSPKYSQSPNAKTGERGGRIGGDTFNPLMNGFLQNHDAPVKPNDSPGYCFTFITFKE
jgi:hypothetical protein